MKINYFFIPLIALLVAMTGDYFTSAGLKKWYKSLKLPSFSPAGQVIGTVWAVIYILATISVLIVWNTNAVLHEETVFNFIIVMFTLNALMNVFWSFIFFFLHMVGYAVLEAGALALSVLALILLIFPISVLAAIVLVPYFVWTCFVAYLNYSIWQLNK
ncbi:MAG: TspO/MBR family protein [Candidatus Doudnabacteria bacterium]